MEYFSEQCHSDTWYVFSLVDDCVKLVQSNENQTGPTAETITARRLILHLVQAFEKYVSPTAEEGSESNDFPYKHGIRDELPVDQLPSIDEIAHYVNEIKDLALDYLKSFTDERLRDNDPLKSMDSNYFRIQHAIFHAAVHLGHIDQLLHDPSDPKGWECFTYSYPETKPIFR
jgi:uncharacterized damage-inducible protein DinB